MKRILQASLLMIVACMGQNINAAAIWVTNKTGITQTVNFTSVDNGKLLSSHFTIAPTATEIGGGDLHLLYVTDIKIVDGQTYGPGSFNLPMPEIDGYHWVKTDPRPHSGYYVKNHALLRWNQTVKFNLVDGSDGKPELKLYWND